MNNKERGERIREQILRDVRHHPSDIAKHIANIFSITPQAVYSHLKQLEANSFLSTKGKGKGKRYFLGDSRKYDLTFQLSDDLAEDEIWRNHFSFLFAGLPENITDICHYGFTEMVNNVIDHSSGTILYISVERTTEDVEIFVMDNGEGIFRRIQRLCKLSDEMQALFELSKGKLTTDPDNHTGEGIFFTSRVFDEFEIDSKGVNFSHDDQYEYDIIDESEVPIGDLGTMVRMSILRSNRSKIQDIFDNFAGPDEYQFNKTIIPVRLAQYSNEKLVSRSQAKRLLARVENFEKVVFDFKGVTNIGQAFADEIFRVYVRKYPNIELIPIHMEVSVQKMITKALMYKTTI